MNGTYTVGSGLHLLQENEYSSRSPRYNGVNESLIGEKNERSKAKGMINTRSTKMDFIIM